MKGRLGKQYENCLVRVTGRRGETFVGKQKDVFPRVAALHLALTGRVINDDQLGNAWYGRVIGKKNRHVVDPNALYLNYWHIS